MTTMRLQHFLLVYDHKERKLVELKTFDSSRTARVAYGEAEREARASGDATRYEIVLIGSDSLETIQTTHASYFSREMNEYQGDLSKYLVGI